MRKTSPAPNDATKYIEQLQTHMVRIAEAIMDLDKRVKRLEDDVRDLPRRLAGIREEVSKAPPAVHFGGPEHKD